jgi:hypothetical protein
MAEQLNRKPEMVRGMSSRQSRFKRDTLNFHLQVFDENRGVNAVETYNFLIEQIGLTLRKDLCITKADLIKPVAKDQTIEKDKDRVKNKAIS